MKNIRDIVINEQTLKAIEIKLMYNINDLVNENIYRSPKTEQYILALSEARKFIIEKMNEDKNEG